MAVNEYDDMMAGAKPAEGNEYDAMIGQTREQSKQVVRDSMFVAAKSADPDRHAEVMKLSERLNLPPNIVDRQFDAVKQNDIIANTDYDAIMDRSPGLAKFLEDPNNATLAKDDLENLGKVDQATRMIKYGPPQKNEILSFPGELKDATKTGFWNLGVAATQLAGAYGLKDPKEAAELIADTNRRAAEAADKRPDYAKEFNATIGKETKDVKEAWNQFTGSFHELREKKIMEGLKDFAVGGIKTAGELVDWISAASVRPRGLAYMVAENLPNAIPSMAAGHAAGLAGGEAGAAVALIAGQAGPQVATPEEIVTVPVGFGLGYTAGYVGGAFMGQVPTEVGSWMNDAMTKRGVDVTDAGQVEQALRDPKLMAQMRAEAQRKGLTTAAVDMLFNAFTGRIAGSLETKAMNAGTKVGKVAHTAAHVGDVAVQMAGETASEYAGQVAAVGQEQADFGEAMQEGLMSLGHSYGETLIVPAKSGAKATYKTYREKFSKNTAEAATEVAQATGHAIEVQNDVQVLNELGQAVKESKMAKRMPEKIRELVVAASPNGEADSVFFQTDDWDSYWTKKGKSPAKAAEQIFGDAGQKYVEAKESGAPLEIPIADYVSKVAPTEDYEGLLPATRTSPDGMSFSEAREHLTSLPETMEALAKEAAGQQAEVQTPDQEKAQASAQSIADNVVEQLKATGLADKDAKNYSKLYEKAFKSLGERTGVDPTKLFEQYNLRINKLEEAQAAASDEKVLNQPKKPELPPMTDQELATAEKRIKEIKAKIEDGHVGDVEKQLLERELLGIEARLPEEKHLTLVKGTLKQDKRGQIRFGKNAINIDLLKTADPSTFIHETGHFYLEVLGDAAHAEGASAQLKADYKTLLDWFGVDSRGGIQTEHHEQFARGFEAYIMEGKAPSKDLRRAFHRFKVWLTSVYRQMRNLNVQLTDEVRGVMDRLLATDEEINQANREQNFEPLFTDPKQVGMSDEQAAKYLEAREEARISAEEQVTKKLIDDFRKSEKSFYKEKRKGVEADVQLELENSREYRALELLQSDLPLSKGQPTFKISEASLKEIGAEKGMPRGIKAKDGVHVEIAAEMLRFANGQQLVETIKNLPKLSDAVKTETDKRMAEFYPDSLVDGTISEEAIKATHNDQRAKMLRMELDHLASENMPVLKDIIRRVARRVPSQATVQEHATNVVASKKVGDIKPHVYLMSERRYAREAGQALARGDIDAAFEAKRKELYNHELYRAAEDARADVEKQVKGFKKLFRTDEALAKTRDTDMVNAARAVLAQFGITKSDKTAAEYLQKISQYDPDTYETISALVEQATQTTGNYKSISYDDFVAMTEAVKALWDMSKFSKEIEIDGKRVAIDQAMGEMSVRFSELTEPGQRAGYDRAANNWDKAKMYLMGIRASLRRVESWADAMDNGNISGVFRRYIVTPIMDATAKYRLAKKDVIQQYLEVVKKVESSLTFQEIAAPELGYTFKDKGELLGAILHTGNDSNMTKMLAGRNWGAVDDNGVVDRSTWNKFIERMAREGKLTKADFDFAQDVWSLLEGIKPEAQRAHKQMYGFYFNEITANELKTPFGNYRGGYVPAVADPFINMDAAIRDEKESLTKSNNSFMFPTAGRGFTKARVEAYRVPLSLNLSLVPGHIDKVMRFVHIEPRVKEVSRMVMDRGFRKTMDSFDPTIGGDMLVPWLQRAAQQKVSTPSQGWGGKALDAFFRTVRTRTGLQVMTANVVNALQQVTGLSIAMVKVKPQHLRNALWTYMKSPKMTSEMVAEKSDFMKTKLNVSSQQIQETIDELLLNPSKYEKARDFAQQHGYFLQSGTQNIVDTITWSGAYDQAVEQGYGEVEAVRSADAAVRATQGSLEAENISRFETGTPFMRAFTMFYSYFNMQKNLLGTEFQKTSREMGLRKGAGRMFYVYTMGFMIPAVLSEMLVRSMSGKGLDEDDDGQYLDDVMNAFFSSQLRSATAMIPGVGPAIQSGINSFNDKWYDDRITTSPAISMIESAVHTPKSVYDAIHDKKKANRAIKDTLSLVGLLTGMPLAPLSRPASYMVDYANNQAKPTGPIDFTRGLITGKSGKKGR